MKLDHFMLAVVMACSAVGCEGKPGDLGELDRSETSTGPATATESSDESFDDETTTVGASGGEPLPAACGCLATNCGVSLCDEVLGDCEFDCYTGFTVNEAALDCVLTALRDRTPGRLDWSIGEKDIAGEARWIYVLEDGNVIEGGTRWDDLAVDCGYATVLADLKPPSYFSDCLTETDLALRFDCLLNIRDSIIGECEPEVECREGT